MNNYYIIAIIIVLIIVLKLLESFQNKIGDTSKSKKIMSNSERLIAQYLDNLGITYKTQYCFPGCRDKRAVPFDFVLFNQKGKVVMAIEYDGEQHSHPVNFHGEGIKNAKKNFEKTKKHDKIKNKYCKRKHIKLIRIDYTQRNNLHKIIKRELILSKLIDA
jgi:hypothetical protein